MCPGAVEFESRQQLRLRVSQYLESPVDGQSHESQRLGSDGVTARPSRWYLRLALCLRL